MTTLAFGFALTVLTHEKVTQVLCSAGAILTKKVNDLVARYDINTCHSSANNQTST